MASKKWIGNALPRAQISTITIANTWATSDTLTVTVNGKDLVLTVGAVTTTDGVAAALKAMLAGDSAVGTETRSETGDDVPELDNVTATVASSVVTLTGDADGVPFTVSVTESTVGSGTATLATPTAAISPNHWSSVDNWDAGAVPVSGVNEQQTITIDATGGTFTVTFGAATTAALAWDITAANMQTALEGLSTIGAGNITVSLNTLVYTLTFKNTLGFQNVAAVTTNAGSLTGGAGTAAVATTVAGSTGDDVYFEDSDVDLLYDIDQNAIALNSLNIAASYIGNIGLPNRNEQSDFNEYLEKYLKVSATTVNIGDGPGAGSQRIKLNVGSNLTTVNVYRTATPADDGLPAFLFSGTNAYNVFNASQGSVGIAVEMGQTSAILTLRCGHEASQDSDVSLRVGSGVTLTTIEQTGGDLEVNSAFTTLNKTGGTTTLKGSGSITTLNLDGGILYDQNTGTKTTVNVRSGSTLDRTRTMLTTTYTNTNLYEGATLRDPFKRITFTNAFALVGCGGEFKGPVTLDLGNNFSLQRS